MGKETGIRYGYLSVCLLTAAFCSCRGPVELGSSFSGPQSWDSQDGTGEMVRKTRYITGIEYPQGYNWMPDLGSNAEGAVLFLMKEDERVLEIPVGYGHCVSADADMHRCIDGHLYTDFSTDQETVVKKDGVEMFRFFGREMIICMLDRDDGIHTLGQPRSGTGWVYRRNGEIILYKGSGQILHGLYMDGESICFSYMDPIETSGGVRNLYYTVKDGSPQSKPFPSGWYPLRSCRPFLSPSSIRSSSRGCFPVRMQGHLNSHPMHPAYPAAGSSSTTVLCSFPATYPAVAGQDTETLSGTARH